MIGSPSDVVVPTNVPAFFTDTKLWFTIAACLLATAFVIKLWRSIPKGLMVVVVFIVAVVVGLVSIKIHN